MPIQATMTNDRKPKVTVTMTRTEADWLLNLLDREARLDTESDLGMGRGLSATKHSFQPASIADRVRAEG